MGSKSSANALNIIGIAASLIPGIGLGIRLAIILASTTGSVMIQRRLAKKAKQELLNSMNRRVLRILLIIRCIGS